MIKTKKTTCSKCNISPHAKNSKYCNACHAANMRVWRITHVLNPLQRKKMVCRSYTHVYLKRGKLTKQPCEVCGDPKSQIHHDDYDKPLEVRWFCRPHHLKNHKENPGL